MFNLTLKYNEAPKENALSHFRLGMLPGVGNAKRVSGEWVPRGRVITIQGIKIRGGLFYFHHGRFELEASCIARTTIESELSIEAPPENHQNFYWGYDLSYRYMSDRDRWIYLHWLAGNRSVDDLDIDLLWVYIYGLEQRLLIDAKEMTLEREEVDHLWGELKRLEKGMPKNIEGPTLTALLSYVWMLYYPHQKPKKNYQHTPFSPSFFRFRLALKLKRKECIPPTMALDWLRYFSNFNFRKIRCATSEFERLFKRRYTDAFGEGLVVQDGGPKLRICFKPLNEEHAFYRGVTFDLDDPSTNKGPMRKLLKIANACYSELSDYENLLRRRLSVKSLHAFSHLPKDLVQGCKHKKARKLSRWIQSHPNFRVDQYIKGGYLETSFDELMSKFGKEKFSNFSKTNIKFLDRVLGRIGFSMVPHPHIHFLKVKKNDTFFLVQSPKARTLLGESRFPFHILRIRLGLRFKSKTSRIVKVLREKISADDKLTESEKTSLVAFLTWIQTRPPNYIGLKAIAGRIGAIDRDEIRNDLVRMATLDGMDEASLSCLEKIYAFLGYEKSSTIKDIHGVMIAGRMPTLHRNPRILDRGSIAIKERQTEKAKMILSEIFESDPETIPFDLPTIETNTSRLNSKQRTFFEQIIGKEEWTKNELQILSKGLGLMLEGILENINDWSYALTDNRLIEFDQSYYVDQDTLEELNQLAGGNNG